LEAFHWEGLELVALVLLVLGGGAGDTLPDSLVVVGDVLADVAVLLLVHAAGGV
jgi:hypothetical protein